MKKIGIITLYYNNYNYGGLLQSFALCEFLRKQGNNAYQIAFNKTGKYTVKKNKIKRLLELIEELSFWGAINKIVIKIKLKVISKTVSDSKKVLIKKNLKKRELILAKFMDQIPHTVVVDEDTISNLNDVFDFFITGSDQVWKPGVYCDEYFLKFTSKKKVAYAASIGRSKLVKRDKDYIINSVKEMDAVSVREKEACDLLERENVNAKLVVDPTLLLTRDDWEKFSEKYDISGKYLFCYFLGTSKKHRDLATRYARNHNLKIVTLPYLSGIVNNVDDKFGDYKLFDVSPKNFVYLIKNAEYIFTDSFHTTVFSGIFNKRFIVFDREEEKTMNGRIVNLLKLYGASNRFVTNIDNIDDLSLYCNVYENEEFIKLRNESINYLKDNY